MSWYLAPSLKAAFGELNRKYPNRSRRSDGSIGDAAHAKTRSDHNPDSRGMVHAIDITHDPRSGVDCERLAWHIIRWARAGKETRVQYVIWNKRIWSRSWDWKTRAYTGTNPHSSHMHISIRYDHRSETNTSSWFDREEDDMKLTDNVKLPGWVVKRWSALKSGSRSVQTLLGSGYGHARAANEASHRALAELGALKEMLGQHMASASGLTPEQVASAAEEGARKALGGIDLTVTYKSDESDGPDGP